MKEYYTIMTADTACCIICGRRADEWHHIIHGTKENKKQSEELGLMAPLCRECHMKLHHMNGELDFALKADAQREFLIHKFGRCYL